MGSDTFCMCCNWHEKTPAPAVLARRGMGAGSACRAQPAFKRTCRIRGVRADQSAFMRRHMAAEFSMGSRYVL